MKPKYWLVLGIAAAGATQSAACTSKFHSCEESRTCASNAGTGGVGDAGDAGNTSEAPAAGKPSGSKHGEQAGAGGDAGMSAEAGDSSALADAGRASAGAAGGSAGSGGAGAAGVGTAGAGGSVTAGAGGGGAAACGASIDLKSDPKNCGSCGHDCLGGECDFGKCLPTTIAPSQSDVHGVATDGVYVYWSAYGEHDLYVARRRVDGSDAIKIVASSEGAAEGLTVSASGVYWLNRDHVRVCAVPDCSGGPSDFAMAASQFCVNVLAVDSGVFWSCSANYGMRDGTFWRAPPFSRATRVQPSSTNPAAIVSSSDSVYWLNSSTYSSDAQNSDGAIWRLRTDTGATTQLLSGFIGDLGSIAVGHGRVYFNTYNAIYYVSLPNGALKPTRFANVQVRNMIVDERAVYWTSDSNGSVFRCPHSDCELPETIAAGQVKPGPLAQDAVSIYWSSYSGISDVRRLAK